MYKKHIFNLVQTDTNYARILIFSVNARQLVYFEKYCFTMPEEIFGHL